MPVGTGGHEWARTRCTGPVDPDVTPEDVRTSELDHALVRDRLDVLGVIAAGGALGAVARYAAGELWPHASDGVPWATLGVNAIGSFLLGLLMFYVTDVWPPRRYVRPFLGVGVLGGSRRSRPMRSRPGRCWPMGGWAARSATSSGPWCWPSLLWWPGRSWDERLPGREGLGRDPRARGDRRCHGGAFAVRRRPGGAAVARRPVPWGTLAVNVLGSLLLGVVLGLAASGAASAEVLTLVGTGFCGR